MESGSFQTQIVESQSEYFRNADAVLDKLTQKYGKGKEGLQALLSDRLVENFFKNKPENIDD